MGTISINEFQIIAGTGIEDYILLSYNGGQGGRIAVGTFKAQMTPSIKDGKWWIGGENTNVIAQGKDGKTPKFRGGANGIEYSYEGEESWSLLVPYSELRLKFEDLSEEQKAQLKMTLKDLSAEDIALLQKPATDMIAVLESTNTQMQAAKEDAQDTADHPTYIGTDHYVYQWNKNTKEYDKTGIYVNGEQGVQGEKGEQGDRGLQGIQGEQGEKGEQGFTPVLEFGGVETLQPSEPASATFTPSGTDGTGNPKYRLDLSIPKGDKGENGNGSGNVLVDASGVVKGKQYVFTPNQNGSAEGTFVEYEIPDIDTSTLVTDSELTEALKSKQDSISDLDSIRSGASKGATAVQPSSLHKVATSGSYNDLNDKPTIPSAVTESTVSGWGFTKNTGTYSKPSTGIPKSDLASAVQTSLGKADTALQSFTETDPVFSASAAAKITDDNISSWNNKVSELESVLFGKFKDALIECFKNVAWINESGNVLVEDLKKTLNIDYSDTGGDTGGDTVDEYVKDGLLFWFDGINNTINGHDSGAQGWIDLTGNGFDLYGYSEPDMVNSKAIKFKDNHVELDGATMLASVNKLGSDSEMFAENPGTLEIVFEQEGDETCVIFIPYVTDNNPNVKGLWYRQASGGYVYSFKTTNEGVAAETGVFTEAKSFSHVYPGGDTLIDGVVLNKTILGGNLSSTLATISVGGRSHSKPENNAYFAKAKIYAIRYYSRALTDVERQRNFNLDKQRFGL